MQNAASVTMLVSRDGTVQAASAALTRQLGHDPELVAGAPLVDIVDDADHGALIEAMSAACAQEPRRDQAPLVVEVRLRRTRDEVTVPFALTIVNLLDDPTVAGLVVSGHDLTDRASVETELRNALSLLSATLDSTADGIVVIDTSGRITSFNRRLAEMWRMPTELLENGDDTAAIEFVLDQLADPEAFLARVNELYADAESESEDTLEFKDGRVFERTSKPQRVDDQVVGRVWSFRDVTDRRRLEAELAHQAFHDPLTNLANTSLFRDRVDHALARSDRTGGRVAVLFLDLDNFKTVNDSLGHTCGDQLLAAVAERLRKCLRAADTAARLGGDEFAVLLEDVVSESDAEAAADRIMTTLTRPFRLAEMDLTVSASVGIAYDAPVSTSINFSATRTWRCTERRAPAKRAMRSTNPRCTSPRSSASRPRPTFAAPRATVSSSSTTNRSSSCTRGRRWAQRHWCAGNTRPEGCSRRRRSFASRRRRDTSTTSAVS